MVISIIAILATLLLGALSAAGETAKSVQTKTLVLRLHNQVITLYESYASRRLPIKPTQGIQQTFDWENQNSALGFRTRVARRKVLAVRELMRMEMPDRYEDLLFEPRWLTMGDGQAARPVQPYLKSAYLQRIRALDSRIPWGRLLAVVSRDNESAECLYMMINIAIQDPAMLEQYSRTNIGDTDQDGMPEFVDAWGYPIEWIRWPAGFESEYQPMFRVHKEMQLQDNPPKNASQLFHSDQPKDPADDDYFLTRDPVGHPDQFNPLNVGPSETRRPWEPGTAPPEYGYGLIPLIMSPGPNGEYGIFFARGNRAEYEFSASEDGSDPYNTYEDSKGQPRYMGETLPDGLWLDNIHNHLIETRER